MFDFVHHLQSHTLHMILIRIPISHNLPYSQPHLAPWLVHLLTLPGGMVNSELVTTPPVVPGIPSTGSIGPNVSGPSPPHTLLLVHYPPVVAPF